MQRLARGRLIDDILSTDYKLTIALFAECSRVLMMHAHRGGSLFRQASIIEDQNAIDRTVLH